MGEIRNLLVSLSAIFSLNSPSFAAVQAVQVKQQGNQIEVFIGGQPFTTYYFGPEAPKPYLHPLRSAQGTIVTRQYPMVQNIPVNCPFPAIRYLRVPAPGTLGG